MTGLYAPAMTANFPAPLPPAGLPSQHPQPAQRDQYQSSQPGQGQPAYGGYQLVPVHDLPRRPVALIIASVLAWCGGSFLLLVGLMTVLVGPELMASEPSLAADPVLADFPDWGYTVVGACVTAWAALVVLGGVLAFCRQLAGAILLALLTVVCAVIGLTPPNDPADLTTSVVLLAYCFAATAPLFTRSAFAFYRSGTKRHRSAR